MLFGDLVEFTALSDARDIEDVRALLSRYFQLCRIVIHRHGGTIEKFIGDAVMAVWGVPSVHEDDAERAVRAGLELVRSIAVLGEEVGASDLRMRVGIVTGEVAVTEGATGEGMVAGDAVNTAARVQSQAEPGQVWVDEATRRLASAAVSFADVGQHALKGKRAPVRLHQACAVVANVGGAARMDGLVAPLTGRNRELSIIKELFHATVEDQRPRLIVVTGAAGVGKSRLGWEFEYYLDGLNDTVFWHRGRCPSYGESVAFWALSEAFRGRLGIPSDADAGVVDARLAEGLTRCVPDPERRRWIEPRLATLLGGSAALADVSREDLFGAWAAFLGHLSASSDVRLGAHQLAAVVVVVEDAHHADEGLLDFLEQAVDSATFPLFVVVIARPEIHLRRPALGSGRRRSSLYVDPLADAQMHHLVDRLVDGLTEPSREALVRRAEGIPLFAVETVRALIDRDAVVPVEGRYAATPHTHAALQDVAAPATVEALVAARLDGLDGEARRLLRDAAVLGLEFTVDALAALGTPAEVAEGLLDRLVDRDFIRPAGRDQPHAVGTYIFVQTVVRNVAYNSLSKHDRRARHLAAAGHLERQEDPAGELAPVIAAHLMDAVAAAPGSDDSVLHERAHDVLLKAGWRALTLGAPAEALETGRRALGLARQGHGQDADALDLCALASRRSGDFEAACAYGKDAVASHERAGRMFSAARSSAELARAWGVNGRSADAARLLLPWYSRTLEWAADPVLTPEERDDRDDATVRVLLDFASALVSGPPSLDPGEGWPAFPVIAERLLVLAERRGDVKSVAQALNLHGWNLHGQGARQVAMALWRHAAGVTREAGRPYEGVTALINLGSFSLPFDLDGARAWVEQAMELAEQVNDRFIIDITTTSLGEVCWLNGDWPRLRALSERVRAQGSVMANSLRLMDHMVRRATGEPTALAGADGPAKDDEELDADVRAWSLFEQELSRRRPDPATVERAVLVYHSGMGPIDDFWLLWSLAVDHLMDHGQIPAAQRLVDLMGAADSSALSPLLRAQLLRFRGELARLEGGTALAETDLADAVRALDDFGARFYAARARLALGQVLVDTGRRAEAHPLLADATRTFEALGAAPWQERSSRLLWPGTAASLDEPQDVGEESAGLSRR